VVQVLRIDVVMKVGAATESVTINAARIAQKENAR